MAKDVPLHDPSYHFQLAPVPKLPSLTVSVDTSPEHISVGLAVALVGATDGVFNVTVTLAHTVVLQSPSALT